MRFFIKCLVGRLRGKYHFWKTKLSKPKPIKKQKKQVEFTYRVCAQCKHSTGYSTNTNPAFTEEQINRIQKNVGWENSVCNFCLGKSKRCDSCTDKDPSITHFHA